MGYIGCIDAQIHIGISYYFLKKALKEIKRTGDYSGLTKGDWVETRQEFESKNPPECDREGFQLDNLLFT